ncbi:MAG: hypothetical protein AAF957_04140 [Planctomycetota bacterium]
MQDAARVLLDACLRAATERDDVRRSLVTLNSWLARELDRTGRDGRETRGRSHGVLTPAARGRDERGAARPVASEERDGKKRISEPLAVVVTRARWKAAACRLALERRAVGLLEGGEAEAASAQAAAREKTLRTRLSTLPDTSTWMLDQPFGLRATEANAFDVDDEVAAKLERVAACYDTLAFAAETAIELDDAGVFRGGPPPAFLYLLAEAQSATLASLAEAPTRSDSDQRDVFLWLKDQTTRYRIYVDRHMRLDDPADPSGSAGLTERIKAAARELTEERQARRQRGQVLNKIRYHVRKLLDDSDLRDSEVESLVQALGRWTEAGFELRDRALGEILEPLRTKATDATGTAADALRALLAPTLENPGERASSRASADGQRSRDDASKDPERSERILAEVRELLEERSVVLIGHDVSKAQAEALVEALGPEEIHVVDVDVEGEAAQRWQTLEECLQDESSDLFLLGVRLDTDEYQRFKERCLERKTPFVRLPGSFAPSAVAHQITRQVGWRLRALRDSSVG